MASSSSTSPTLTAVPASGAASRMFKALHAWRGRLSGDRGRELAHRREAPLFEKLVLGLLECLGALGHAQLEVVAVLLHLEPGVGV